MIGFRIKRFYWDRFARPVTGCGYELPEL